MNIDPNRNVGRIAAETPALLPLLDQWKIDYCCGGEKSLAAACEAAGVPLWEVLDAISKLPDQAPRGNGRDWNATELRELATFIVDHHHFFTRNVLSWLRELARDVFAAHGAKHPELGEVRTIVEELRSELIPHMLKEEQVLFPYVNDLETAVRNGRPAPPAFFGTVKNPIQMMKAEHDAAAEKLEELRKISFDYRLPPEACAKYQALYKTLIELETDLHRHIHLENNIFFPRAEELEESSEPEMDFAFRAVKGGCSGKCAGH